MVSSFISGRGTYQETKFDDDAEKVTGSTSDRGYIKANVGAPELKVLGDSADKKTRWIELRIPITEGPRYKVGTFDVAGNTVVKTEFLKPLFKMMPGEYYGEKNVRKGLEKAREVYGAAATSSSPASRTTSSATIRKRWRPRRPAALAARPPRTAAAPPIVDVTMRMQEGLQFFVNRITFVGNTTTRDNVIRREMRLVETASSTPRR